MYKPEVETVPKTGSTNKLRTETDVDTISVAIKMLFGGGGKLANMNIDSNTGYVYRHYPICFQDLKNLTCQW